MRKTFFISLLALCFSAMTWAETIQVGTYNDLDNALYSGTAEKVQLTADIELGTYALQPNRVVELDLNGFTINQAANNGANYILYAPYNITITNGTLNQLKTNATSVLLTAADAKITLNNVNVTTVANIGVYVNGANGELEINGSSVTAAKQGVHLHSTNTKVTLNSGSIDVTGTSSSYGIYMQGDACAAIVNGGSVSANGNASCGVYVAKGGNLTVTNGTINGSSFAISGNGTDGLGGTTITITDGTIGSANTSLGIYHPQAGTLNISGGTITGKTGVYVKSGTLNVTGGNIVGTGAQAAYTNDGNGASSTGDGLVVDACNYPGGAPVINVTGGNFESANANAVGCYKKDESVTPAEGNISGGTYDSEVPVALCAEGFVSVTAPNAQGLYVVEQANYQREVTNTYGTLCLPKDGEVIGATVFRPAYKNGAMIFFEEVDGNRIEGGHGYLFQRKADYTKVSVKYDANAVEVDEPIITSTTIMIGSYVQAPVAADQNYAIIYNDKYYRVNSDNVYVGANCAYIDMNRISDNVAPVPGRRYISFQDASANQITALENVEAAENANVQKVMVDGQLYIIRGEQIYNVAGQVVK